MEIFAVTPGLSVEDEFRARYADDTRVMFERVTSGARIGLRVEVGTLVVATVWNGDGEGTTRFAVGLVDFALLLAGAAPAPGSDARELQDARQTIHELRIRLRSSEARHETGAHPYPYTTRKQ